MDKYILYIETVDGFRSTTRSFDSIAEYEDYIKSNEFAIAVRELEIDYIELWYSATHETVPTTPRDVEWYY